MTKKNHSLTARFLHAEKCAEEFGQRVQKRAKDLGPEQDSKFLLEVGCCWL